MNWEAWSSGEGLGWRTKFGMVSILMRPDKSMKEEEAQRPNPGVLYLDSRDLRGKPPNEMEEQENTM